MVAEVVEMNGGDMHGEYLTCRRELPSVALVFPKEIKRADSEDYIIYSLSPIAPRLTDGY